MNPSYRLEKLNRAARRRITKLRTVVGPLSLPVSPEADRLVAWTIIEARNLWASFLRAYYLSNESGSKLEYSAGSRHRALATITITGLRS